MSSSLFSHGWCANRLVPFCTALIVTFLLFSVAEARLTGQASLTYTDFNGSSNSVAGTERNKMSSHSLVQDYSLLYSENGTIYNSRVGRYNVSLGYNWTALDTTFNKYTVTKFQTIDSYQNYNETRGHLQYTGEIFLDPKEVPFKLNLFSRDVSKNTVVNSSGDGRDSFASIIGGRDLPTNINDGMHIETGATLVAGVKNGMTNGYNEVLRHFPMILIDYKDTVNRDLRSVTPVDDRLSRLAFVSLNKKDNWFHYRHTEYEDYINSRSNYRENEVQLGTVDQYRNRRWIDFANWIRVSTDLQLSERSSNYQSNPIEEINLNLFVETERKSWNARTFTTFNRLRDDLNKLSYVTTLPLYAEGVVSRDVSWNARTSYRNSHDTDALGATSTFTNMLVGYRVDALKRAPFTLSHNLDLESSTATNSDLLNISGGIETNSTVAFSRRVTLGASYNIRDSITTDDIAGTKSNYLEQTINLKGAYTLSDTLRFDARQALTLTNGSQSSFSGSARDSVVSLTSTFNPRNLSSDEAGTESYHSITGLSLFWNPKPRLNVALTVTEDLYKSATVPLNSVTEILANATYTSDVWEVADTLKLSRGNKDLMAGNTNSVSDSLYLKYTHSRNLEASANASFSANTLDGKTTYNTDYEQRVNYSYLTKSGISRRLFEFNETLKYSGGSADSNSTFIKSLTLGAKYYPIRLLTLAGGLGYSYTTSISDHTIIWYTSMGVNFRALQASLDYYQGLRKADGARENRFTGNIRKAF